MPRRPLTVSLLGAAVLIPWLLAGAQDAPPAKRDPFKTPPGIKRAAQQVPSKAGKPADVRAPRLHGLLRLKGKKPGALIRVGEETFVVRAGDELEAPGRTLTVKAIDDRGVTLTQGSDGQRLRLRLR